MGKLNVLAAALAPTAVVLRNWRRVCPIHSSPLKAMGGNCALSGPGAREYTAEASLMYSHAKAPDPLLDPEAHHGSRSHHRFSDPAPPRLHRAGDGRGDAPHRLLPDPQLEPRFLHRGLRR